MTQSTFILNTDSSPELIKASSGTTRPKEGRKYTTTEYFSKQQPDDGAAIRITEVLYGMKCASLAITDDKKDTLKKIGRANPWHIKALSMITGSRDEAHKPLSTILYTHMNLHCDHIIDISGITPGGHPLDTQGYIAHNDEVIVLSFRCTTSFKDWWTNLNTSSSDWELEEDLAQGFSGYFSGLEGLCCVSEYKPRVHTGFYNNFLATVPLMKKYIDPLLHPDQPSRTLYVTGHSLGAGIATLATCYYLLEYDWLQSPHKIVSVTAGSPRACQNSMAELINEKMNRFGPYNKAVMCRLVRNKDIVSSVPPSLFGFVHVGKLVYITDEGDILINPNLRKNKLDVNEEDVQKVILNNDEEQQQTSLQDNSNSFEKDDESFTKYDSAVKKIPTPLRDHMPDFYLTPLIHLFEKEAENPIRSRDQA